MMLKRIIRISLAVVVVFAAVVVGNNYWRHLLEAAGMMAASDYLSWYELYKYKGMAKSGDMNAIKRLQRYYGGWKNDMEAKMEWTLEGARRGDPLDQFHYGVWLIREYGERNSEGIEWIKLAAMNGHQRAIDFLEKHEH